MSCSSCHQSKPLLVPTVRQAAKGVVSIIKTRIGNGLAISALIDKRKNICYACDKLNRGIVNQCTECKCIIDEKVLRNEESCPLMRW